MNLLISSCGQMIGLICINKRVDFYSIIGEFIYVTLFIEIMVTGIVELLILNMMYYYNRKLSDKVITSCLVCLLL